MDEMKERSDLEDVIEILKEDLRRTTNVGEVVATASLGTHLATHKQRLVEAALKKMIEDGDMENVDPKWDPPIRYRRLFQ